MLSPGSNSDKIEPIDVDAIDIDVIDVDAIANGSTSANSLTDANTYSDILSDPLPDVHALFAYYNEKYFDSQLNNVYVEFSTRMTLCAGTCTYKGPIGGCRIALSEPLLKFRTSNDLRSTLLHEMIHAQLFNRGVSRDGPDGHGPLFMEIADRINKSEPASVRVTPYHDFVVEVDHYRTHHWKCFRCNMMIKRAMNRTPGPHDSFWNKHETDCGGTFLKISQPPKVSKAPAPKFGAIAIPCNTRKLMLASVPPGTVPTRRIDEMLSQKHKVPSEICPRCCKSVPKNRYYYHIDRCSSDRCSSYNLKGDRSISGQTLSPSIPKNFSSKISKALDPAISMQQTCSKYVSIDNTTKPIETVNEEMFARFALSPQSFSPSHIHHAYNSLCSSQNSPPDIKPAHCLSQILAPLFQDTPREREQQAIAIIDSFVGLSQQSTGGVVPPKQVSPVAAPQDGRQSVSVGNEHFEIERSNSTKNSLAHATAKTPKNNNGMEKASVCPLCNRRVLSSQFTSHLDECMNNVPFNTQICDEKQTSPDKSFLQNNTTAADTPIDISNCPICDTIITRQALEAHVNDCMTSTGLREAF